MKGMFYDEKPQFYGVKAAAANIGQQEGNYTAGMFQEDFPQFFRKDGTGLAPAPVLEMFLGRANGSIQPDKWLEAWRYAAGLYVAHYLSMYLSTYAESSETPAQAAQSGALMGVIKSARLGDSSVTYDGDALTKATEDWGSLNATKYGQMLATEARLIGLGGTYVL